MPALADTLDAIAAEGASLFYEGRIGQAIADHVQALGGILTREDMAGYRAPVVNPLRVVVRGQTLATPPPGSGGLTSLQMVALYDRLVQRGRGGAPGSAAMYEALIEIDKVVWEERLTVLADAKTMSVSPESLLTDAHHRCARSSCGSSPGSTTHVPVA